MPFEVVSRRMLVAAAFSPGKYSSALACAYHIVESEGKSALFTGWQYPIIMGFAGALSLLVYRTASALLAKPGHPPAMASDGSEDRGHSHDGALV